MLSLKKIQKQLRLNPVMRMLRVLVLKTVVYARIVNTANTVVKMVVFVAFVNEY